MSTKLMIAMEDSVLTFESSKTGWKKAYESLKGTHPQCITFDPNNPNRTYCGTFGGGLWKTDDGGQSWSNIGKDTISSSDVMSVSVSSLERGGGKNDKGFNTVYVGTEPTAFYRSDDGGDPTTECMYAIMLDYLLVRWVHCHALYPITIIVTIILSTNDHLWEG